MKNIIKKTGILKHNDQGRYELQDGHYFTSGDRIEIFYDLEGLEARI